MSPAVQNFVVKADDLELIAELGRGAYGVVDKMKHVPSGVIMAVKVGRKATTQVT